MTELTTAKKEIVVLPKEIQAQLNEAREKILELKQKTIWNIIETGKILKEKQDLLADHYKGNFIKWVEDECGLSKATAYRYIEVFCYVVSQGDNLKNEVIEELPMKLLAEAGSKNAPEEFREAVASGEIRSLKEAETWKKLYQKQLNEKSELFDENELLKTEIQTLRKKETTLFETIERLKTAPSNLKVQGIQYKEIVKPDPVTEEKLNQAEKRLIEIRQQLNDSQKKLKMLEAEQEEKQRLMTENEQLKYDMKVSEQKIKKLESREQEIASQANLSEHKLRLEEEIQKLEGYMAKQKNLTQVIDWTHQMSEAIEKVNTTLNSDVYRFITTFPPPQNPVPDWLRTKLEHMITMLDNFMIALKQNYKLNK